jgi:hypothetical protein
MIRRLSLAILVATACASPDDADVPLPDEDEVEQTPTPPDDMPTGEESLPSDPAWQPRWDGRTRFVVFYQINPQVLEIYADPTTGLPRRPGNGYIFSISHASAPASLSTANLIHSMRDDFFYAPAFDMFEHEGWETASDAQIAQWGHDFRDKALAAHADMFSFNEAPTTTAANPALRVRMMKMLRALNDPDPQGRRLRGVMFFTHKPSMPQNWTTPGTDFWRTVDETCDAVVVEHYHSQGFVCTWGEEALSEHLFAMREWFEHSGDPNKRSIANRKYTVLHSSRYAEGSSGWQGADSTKTTLAEFQRALSKLTKITRNTPGGINRICYAPTNSVTAIGVMPRITQLVRWHYGAAAPSVSETACVAGAQSNCSCPVN